MMLAVPKSDILQAIMVTYGNLEEVKEFLGTNFVDMRVLSSRDIIVSFQGTLIDTEIQQLFDYQVASTGDVVVKLATGEFIALRPWMFVSLFDCHFVPDKSPDTWENSNDREISKKTGQS